MLATREIVLFPETPTDAATSLFPSEHQTFTPCSCIFSILLTRITITNHPEIDRSGFLPLLQDQKLLQNQKEKLLPDTEAPVHAEAPVKTGAPVVTESHHSYVGLQKL